MMFLSHEMNLASRILLLLLLPLAANGCAEEKDMPQELDRSDRDRIMTIVYGELPSASYLLLPKDIAVFRVGKSREEVLNKVNWRGNFGIACEHKGKSVSAITYELVLREELDTTNIEGEWLYAIFIDNKFGKFVSPGKPDPKDFEEIQYEGTTWRRRKSIKIGDITYLIKAIESEPVNIAALEQKLKVQPAAPRQVDPGLTAAYLLLRAAGKAPEPASAADYARNAALRDQFNAARLDIGMMEAEVETIFKAKPLESGNVEAGQFKVYGSNESFDINSALHYSNVLVLFKEGRANVIYCVPGGADWRQDARERFLDFPRSDN